MKYIFVLVEFKHPKFFSSYADCLLNTKLQVPSVGFSVAGLDRAKLGVYQFQSFLFIVVMVISILPKPAFWQISIYSQSLASERLYRNTLRAEALCLIDYG